MELNDEQRNQCITVLHKKTKTKLSILKNFEQKLFDFLFFLDGSKLLYFNVLLYLCSSLQHVKYTSVSALYDKALELLTNLDTSFELCNQEPKLDIIKIIGKNEFLKCPLCNAVVISQDAQTRAADEGSTTFYSCTDPECTYRKKQN